MRNFRHIWQKKIEKNPRSGSFLSLCDLANATGDRLLRRVLDLPWSGLLGAPPRELRPKPAGATVFAESRGDVGAALQISCFLSPLGALQV